MTAAGTSTASGSATRPSPTRTSSTPPARSRRSRTRPRSATSTSTCTRSRSRARRALALTIEALSALLLFLAGPAAAQTRIDTVPVLTGLFNAYAPTVLGTRMWIAGWLTAADVPFDKVYRSELVDGAWTPPVPSFERIGFGVNDPSVVVAPNGTTLMYFTSIDAQCAPQPNCYLADNLTSAATSADGGITWSDKGVVLGADNGVAPCGAWAPSAIVVGNEVWVYFHGANPSFSRCSHPSGTVFRARFDRTGLVRIDTRVIPTPLPVVNVDVSRRPGDDAFVMVANSPDLTKVWRLVSADGLAWTLAPALPLIDAGTVWTPTPHVTWVSPTEFDLWVGTAQTPGNTSIHQVERSRWRE